MDMKKVDKVSNILTVVGTIVVSIVLIGIAIYTTIEHYRVFGW